jgi:hypothetical protein
MVLLTMTPAIVEGLQVLNTAESNPDNELPRCQADAPSLDNPAAGNPVSHSQVLDLWKALKIAGHQGYSMERLLKGSNVYVPPPPPKPEPVS